MRFFHLIMPLEISCVNISFVQFYCGNLTFNTMRFRHLIMPLEITCVNIFFVQFYCGNLTFNTMRFCHLIMPLEIACGNMSFVLLLLWPKSRSSLQQIELFFLSLCIGLISKNQFVTFNATFLIIQLF